MFTIKETKKTNKNSEESSEFANIAASKSVEYEEVRKSVYQIDSEGFLMDGDRRYILSESGSMIRLNGEQIAALMESKVI